MIIFRIECHFEISYQTKFIIELLHSIFTKYAILSCVTEKHGTCTILHPKINIFLLDNFPLSLILKNMKAHQKYIE